MKRIPIGVSDFEKLREGDYYFVDKSMLIADVIRGGAEVLLLPRPRRFGKTLNLSMLHAFFDMDGQNVDMFQDLEVGQHEDVMAHCGGYPTIFLSFKDLKFGTYEDCYTELTGILSKLFMKHKATLEAMGLEDMDQIWVEAILKGQAEPPVFQRSLALLSELLHKATGKKAVILIDEYDMPIHSGFHNGYYNDIIGFMRNLLSGAYKDNKHLEKGVLTGIMRIAKESIFSGFNNAQVWTILDEDFSQYFGFTQGEVDQILADTGQEGRAAEVAAWYNGYLFGERTMYNPWSIMQFMTVAHRPKAVPAPYWVNTSDNQLIRHLITRQNALSRKHLETLLSGGCIRRKLDTNIVLAHAATDSLWSMLALSGYVTSRKTEIKKGYHHCDLAIPNLEVRTFFENTVEAWSNEQTGGFGPVLDALLEEDMREFAHHFTEAVRFALSYHDTAGNVPERVYHVFLLGMLATLSDDYQVRSNRESGLGRYDILLIPRDLSRTGFVFEFKQTETNPEATAQAALDQIRENHYDAELRQAGVTAVRAVGVAMCGKQAAVETTLL